MSEQVKALLQRYSDVSRELEALVARLNYPALAACATDMRRIRGALPQAPTPVQISNRDITAFAAEVNLLSLQLALESTRLGEDGRESALLAEEVRKIAEEVRTYLQDQGLQATPPNQASLIDSGKIFLNQFLRW